MKVITPDKGYSSFLNIFKEVQDLKQKVVFWQVSAGKRTVCDSLLISFDFEPKLLSFLSGEERISSALPIFFYIEDQLLIFKSRIEEINTSSFTVGFPKELRRLDESDDPAVFLGYKVNTMWVSKTGVPADRINDLVRVKSMKERTSRDQDFLNSEFDHITLDEEDKIFADKRESPRVRPKAEKLVKIVKKGESKMHVMKLFDLSRGGLGFITFNPDKFPKGAELLVLGFDAFELDDPLVGTIMSHRAVDEANLEFKIGIKFNEGQE